MDGVEIARAAETIELACRWAKIDAKQCFVRLQAMEEFGRVKCARVARIKVEQTRRSALRRDGPDVLSVNARGERKRREDCGRRASGEEGGFHEVVLLGVEFPKKENSDTRIRHGDGE